MSTMGIHSKPIDGTVTANGHQLVPLAVPSPLQKRGATSVLPRPDDTPGRRPDGDTVIRVLAAVVVLAVAAFAAIVSYSHIFELGRGHGQDGTAARLLPLSVDGLIASASLVMLYAARNDITLKRVSWPRVMLWLGIGATVAANVLYGLPFGWLAAVVSAWPAVAFVGSVEMAVRFARDTRRDTPAGRDDTHDTRDNPRAAGAASDRGAQPPGQRVPAVTGDRPRKPAARKPTNKDLAAAQGVSVRTLQRRRATPSR